MEITLKNIKYMAELSTDSNCFHAIVCVDGHPAFTAEDDGNGGCIDFHPIGRYDSKAYTSNSILLAQAEAWARSLPPIPFGGDSEDTLEMNLELYVAEIVEKWIVQQENAKVFKRVCKTKTVFTLPTTQAGEYQTYDRPFGPRMEAWMKEKHPDAVILNYQYGGILSAEKEKELQDALDEKRYKKQCKTKTLFRKGGDVMFIDARFTPTARTQLMLKYGEDVEILNEKYMPPVYGKYVPLYCAVNHAGTWKLGMTRMVPPDQVESEKQSPSDNIRFTADFQQLREWLGK